jgi:hypothetical protein
MNMKQSLYAVLAIALFFVAPVHMQTNIKASTKYVQPKNTPSSQPETDNLSG